MNIQTLRDSWHEFRRCPPGRRFQQRYERRQRQRGAKSALRPLYIGAGLLLAAVGLFFMAVPGPGIPVLVLGAVLMAGESLRVARWLDGLERRWRRWRDKRA